ncbi:FAD-dependent oxidoreductase [Streptosporangium sandarakinum]|uniref:FAD-dependent oxidoreductase n=1 Tax=Streptosporangium sandarakinum TaxID=1260955 RepID=UPI003710564B
MQHRILVLGAGYTGAVAAGRLARRLRREDVAITLVNAEPDFVERVRMHQLATGQDLTPRPFGEMLAGTGVEADRVVIADGGTIPAAVTVWTTGFAVHPIAKATTLEVTGTGQIVVDATMRSVSHPDVYAVGDAAMAMGPGNKPLRMSCASGTPAAWQAADAIAARLTGGKLPNASIRYFNQCISLGRRDGLIQYVTADDRAVRAVLTGRLAAVYKELICRSAAWGVANPTLGMPTRRRRVTRERAAAGEAVKATA